MNSTSQAARTKPSSFVSWSRAALQCVDAFTVGTILLPCLLKVTVKLLLLALLEEQARRTHSGVGNPSEIYGKKVELVSFGSSYSKL